MDAKVVGKPIPIEAVVSHEQIAAKASLIVTPPKAGTPGSLKPEAGAFTAIADPEAPGGFAVWGSMNFNSQVSPAGQTAVRNALVPFRLTSATTSAPSTVPAAAAVPAGAKAAKQEDKESSD